MISIQNITALLAKQIKDILKNMPVLLLFIIYPLIAFFMLQAMKDQAGTGDVFLAIFGTMHCVFTPLITTSALISEEKEKNTLRMLIMSGVTLREYMISTGGFILAADLITGSTFLFIADKTLSEAPLFLLGMGIGCLISIIGGICIGLYAKNTNAASGLAVPFGMVFAFLPMLAYFNKSVKAIAKFTYSEQVSNLLSGSSIKLFGISILCISLIVFTILASILYRRSLAEE